MTKPPWMQIAEIFKGESEIPGAMHNGKIVEMFRLIGQPEFREDEIPWCAAALGACLSLSGYANTRSALARSYENFGDDLGSNPKEGCIAVLSRGKADSGQGHVGFYAGEDKGKILLLGGNQKDGFNIQPIARSRLIFYRWPRRIAELPETFLPTILDVAEQDAPAHLRMRMESGGDAAGQASPFLGRMGVSETFLRCHEIVAKWEGGFVNHVQDPGGATNFGITLETLSDWRGRHVTEADVRELTYGEAVEIFASRYWSVIQGDDLPAPAALMTYNAAVNCGPPRGVRLLQRSLVRQGIQVDVDGEMGPQTIGAVKTADLSELVRDFMELHEAFYEGLSTFATFGRGWLNRLVDVKGKALDWALDSQLKHAPTVSETDLTTIDKVLGGKALTGKKTLIAAITYLALVIAEGMDWLPKGFVQQSVSFSPSPSGSGSVPALLPSLLDVAKTVLLGVAGLGAVSKIERGLSILKIAVPIVGGIRRIASR